MVEFESLQRLSSGIVNITLKQITSDRIQGVFYKNFFGPGVLKTFSFENFSGEFDR